MQAIRERWPTLGSNPIDSHEAYRRRLDTVQKFPRRVLDRRVPLANDAFAQKHEKRDQIPRELRLYGQLDNQNRHLPPPSFVSSTMLNGMMDLPAIGGHSEFF